MSKLIKKEYKDYTIIIEEQEPSVPKPETEEEWDKHFETHGGETKGTHRYKVLDKEEVIINEDDTDMWDTQACMDNAMADIEAEEEQKEYDNAKEDYEEIANSMSKQDLIDFYVEKMLEDNSVITERQK